MKLLLFTVIFIAMNTHAARVEPHAGKWKTWIVSAPQLRSAEPPGVFESRRELHQIHKEIKKRTATDLNTISYWDTGSPGYRWFQIAREELSKRGTPPPLATRALAILGAAIYDTTIVTWDSKYEYKRKRPNKIDPFLKLIVPDRNVPSYPSEHAATAAVASAVLAYLFPDNAAHFNQLAEEASHSRLLAGANYPSDLSAGTELGKAVANQIIEYAKKDHSDAVFTGSFPPGPGLWSGKNPTTPLAGTWKPWVLSSGSELRLPTPPAFDSKEEAAQLAMVRALKLTPAQLQVVWAWQAGFVNPWLDILNTKIFEYKLDANAPRAARAYALQSIAMHDAIIACFDSKYAYLTMRPPQIDPTFTSVYSIPGNPSYPAGHTCGSAGVDTVLSYLFPADAALFHAKAIEAGQSTFYAGIHFQIDEDAGLALGHAVGAKVLEFATNDGSKAK
jgi:membrane-associated phospholipid phosphatase